jgi:hypothetical protein
MRRRTLRPAVAALLVIGAAGLVHREPDGRAGAGGD